MNVANQVLGAFIGIICILALYGAGMLVYFAVKKKYPNAKYWVEFLVIGVALSFSIVVKSVILFVVDESAVDAFASGFANVLHALYSGFGGLTFEGLDKPSEVGSALLQCLYTGTSVYASLIFFSVVTATANYEIFSRVRLLFTYKKNKDVFVFTAVTEDALALAESIENENENNVVIFTGEELEGFDRKNELHREIMSKGYLYWSFYKNKEGTRASIITRLKLYVANDALDDEVISATAKHKSLRLTTGKRFKRIHFFALSNNARLSGLESVNSGVVFDEIKVLTSRYLTSRTFTFYARPIVNFYILTDSTVNYSAYSREKELAIKEGLKERGIAESNELLEELALHFQLNVINDAVLGGKDLAKKRTLAFDEAMLLDDVIPNENNEYKAVVFGFGETGQQAMKQLFINTSYVDESRIPSRFVADVYDEYGGKFGLFESTHPSFICNHEGRDGGGNYQKLLNAYGLEGKEEEFNEVVDKWMGFPRVTFHESSAFSVNFEQPDASNVQFKDSYKAFIVALGSDEDNVSLANALIESIKYGIVEGKGEPTKVQTVYVNVRDEKNRHRINWTEEDETRFKGLKVISFGATNDVYSYGAIIEEKEAKAVNFGYNLLSNSQAERYLTDMQNVFDDEKNLEKDYEENLRKIRSAILLDEASFNSKQKTLKWLNIGIFVKESNKAAALFKPYFRARLNEANGTTGRNIVTLANLEHVRWDRFHMANGWIYGSYGKEQTTLYKSLKRHNCLVPFEDLGEYKRYDITSIAISYDK